MGGVRGELEDGRVDLLLVSPERFNNLAFRDDVLPALARATGLLVVDEAHCISDWGARLPPRLRRLVRLLDLLPRGVPILCTTATANDRVVADVTAQIGSNLETFRGTLERESLALSVVYRPSQADRLTWLAEHLETKADAVRTALEALIDTERRRRIGEVIADGYRRIPQDDDEVRAATRAAIRSIHEEPW